MTSTASSGRMSPLALARACRSRRSSALRMLACFSILPVFAVHAQHLPGATAGRSSGSHSARMGSRRGYCRSPTDGLRPLRAHARHRDRLLLCAARQLRGRVGPEHAVVILGRSLQGAGAIAAPVTAFAADIHREEHPPRRWAMIGGSIALCSRFAGRGPGLVSADRMGGISE